MTDQDGAQVGSRTKKPAEVMIFGEDVSRLSQVKDKNRQSIVWGTVVMLSGIVLLLNSFGVLSWDIWHRLIQFWPLLLILAGLKILLGENPVSRFLVSVVAVLGIVLVVLLVIWEQNPQYLAGWPVQLTEMLLIISRSSRL